MQYSRPPLVVQGFTIPHIDGTINTVILAAPGAGFAYRIVAIAVGINRTSAGALVEETYSSIGSAAPVWRTGALGLTGTSHVEKLVPGPGIQLPENEGLNLASQSSAAAGVTIYTVNYFIDNV